MEKQIALVNKTNQRVVNILVVDSLDKSHINQWETNELDVIAVKDSIPYVNGLWDGKEFLPPDNEYLKEINLITNNSAQAETKLTAKADLLAKLGITAEEAALLLS
jgi:protein involved in polysaccharide export with SLBB domain